MSQDGRVYLIMALGIAFKNCFSNVL